MSTTGERPTDRTTVYQEVQASPEFAELRRRVRRFIFPMTVAFLLWYLAYVLLATYAPAFMATKLAGNITVGLIIGLLQFVSTFVITTIYVNYANKRVDPLGRELAQRIEGSQS